MTKAVLWCAVSTKEQAEDDKFSLDNQEAESRALAAENGWTVAAVLRVPGHSRNYIDIHELAADARAKGIDAFDRILDLWKRKAFDVLICRDGNRFARTQTLHAYFTESTIGIGARIYSFADDWINDKNYRQWTMANGYKAASEKDWLVKARNDGMIKRMERGLNGGLDVPDLYRIVRDDRGKALRLEFRQEYRRMMDNAAALLLERVGWKAFAVEMYNRFGHANPSTNEPYHDNTFYRWFFSPYVWGITAKGYANKFGAWVFDETVPLPDGVKVNRNPNPAIPPVWCGETADNIKAELYRRLSVVKGRAVSRTKYAFTGLFECDVCGRRMAADANKSKYLYWRCSSHTYRHYKTGKLCSNRKNMRDELAQEQISDFLERLLAQDTFDFVLLTSGADSAQRSRQDADSLTVEINKLRGEIDTMIVRQSKAPANVQDNYARQIDRASERLAVLESNLKQTVSSVESPVIERGRTLAYERLQASGLAALWELPAGEINQLLHALMGKHRFIVSDGEIIEVRLATVSKSTFVKAGSLPTSIRTVTVTSSALRPFKAPDQTGNPKIIIGGIIPIRG